MTVILPIKVIPSAGENRYIIDKTGQLKWYLKSAPERGKANKELIKSIAKVLKIAQSDISIVAGQTGRNKRVKIISDKTEEEIHKLLGIEKQTSLF